MTIPELQTKLGITRAELAEKAGVSYCQLTNAVSRGANVVELKSGDYVLMTKDATIFKISKEG